MQSVAIGKDLFLLGSQILHFACLLRCQHFDGDDGEVPSPGVTIRASMLQLVHEAELGRTYNRFDLAVQWFAKKLLCANHRICWQKGEG